MTSFKKSAATLACLATLAACAAKQDSKTLDVNEINNRALSAGVKADQLARAGEQLAQSSGFPLADAVLDQALAADPSNKVAQFYKAFLADKMVLKGIAVRIRPLLTNDPKSAKQFDAAIAKIPNGALRDFLLDGTEDIKTEKDVQAFADQMYSAREKFRQFLKANKDSEITLRLNDMVAGARGQSMMKDCSVTSPDSGVYKTDCDFKTVAEVKLNRADMEALQLGVAGVQIYAALYNAYNLTGSIDTAKKFKDQNPSASQVYAELAKYPEFGTVHDPAQLRSIVDMGLDGLTAVRWAASAQSTLCPQGEGAKNQRPGYLFKDGICIRRENGSTNLEAVLAQVELGLKGGAFPVNAGQSYQSSIVPVAALQNPVADLKTLSPRFNKCNEIVNVSNNTVNGLLPNGDVNVILNANTQCQ